MFWSRTSSATGDGDGSAILGESPNSVIDDPKKLPTASCVGELCPDPKLIRHRRIDGREPWPGILGVWTVVSCQSGGQALQIICQRRNSRNPIFQVLRPAESKIPGYSSAVGVGAVVESLKKPHKRSVTLPRGIAGSPKVRLSKFLRDHLQVMELMARNHPLST
jgi:hypothetical protein